MNDRETAFAAVQAALSAGASDADAVIVDSDGSTVQVRDGSVETVEHHRDQGLGVRAYLGTRTGLAYSNDVSPEGAREAGRRAAELAALSGEDPAAGLPAREDTATLEPDLDLVDASHPRYTPDLFRDLATRCEGAALADERITRSEGARSGGGRTRLVLANSQGLSTAREKTMCSVSVSVFATGSEGERQRAGYGASACHLSDLEAPEEVGREAAVRATRRCGWRKPPSGPVPVVLSPDMACDFARTVAGGLNASKVFRGQTYLAESLGQEIGSSVLTLVDDGVLPRRPGSAPFDGEGVATRRTVLVERGRLASWLADSYAARKTGTRPTGNAGRSLSGSLGIVPHNLILEHGERSADALIGDVKSGLYLTDLFGFGVNMTAGTWSRGGSGIWIENGQLTYPVQEFTIAGDLRDLLRGVREAASDLTWRGSCAAPTLLVDGFTVAAG
jgi:PmbA protein